MNKRILLFGLLTVFITLVTATSSAADPAVDLEENCDCTIEDVPTQPADEPVWGWADIHEHQFADLAYGGTVFWGSPFDEGGIEKALAPCNATKDFHVRSADLGLPEVLKTILALPEFLGIDIDLSFLDTIFPGGVPLFYVGLDAPPLSSPIHGSPDSFLPWPLNALNLQTLYGFNNNVSTSYFNLEKKTFKWHDTGGWPDFEGWPRYDQGGHQQMYYEWLERAYKGGMRLMVNLTVNNEVLCEISMKRDGYQCDDMSAVNRQIEATYAMQDYIDSMCEGENCGWYRVVETPEDARKFIREGKMAVVLGIEVDALFNCKHKNTCTRKEITDYVREYYEKGIRHIFIVHFADNQFTGAAIMDNWVKEASAFLSTSDPRWLWGTWDCSELGYDVECNVKGLSEDGEFLVDELMAKKMIIDVDHLSFRAMEGYLDENGKHQKGLMQIAEEERYPLISSHSAIRPDDNPGASSVSEATRIRDMGGMVALVMPRGKCQTSEDFLTGKKEEGDEYMGYFEVVDLMSTGVPPTHVDYPGVGLQNDFGAFLSQPGPRFGADAAGCEAQAFTQLQYPFEAFDGSGHQFDKVNTGTRIFDYNSDGLAHVGMMPDMLADLEAQGVTRSELDPIFNSAEAYIRMWEKIEYCHPDVDPPIISCPSSIADSTVGQGGQVFFDLPAVEDRYYCDWWPEVSSDVVSGSYLDTGVTPVTVNASDNANLSSSCQFNLNVSCFGVNQALVDDGCTGIEGIAFRNIGNDPYIVEVSPGSYTYPEPVDPNDVFTIYGSHFGADVLPSPIHLTYTPLPPPGSTGTTESETITISTGCSDIILNDEYGPFKVDEFGPVLENSAMIHITGAFDPGAPFDPATVDVTYTLTDNNPFSGLTITNTIPAGSFVVDGQPGEGKYRFVSAAGEDPAIDASFDFAAGSFEFKVEGSFSTDFGNTTELTASVQIGEGALQNSGDQTLEFQAQSHQLVYEAESSVDCSVRQGNLPVILSSIQQMIESNQGTHLADELEAVLEQVEVAQEELDKELPDYQAILGNLVGAVRSLERALKDGLLDGLLDEEHLFLLDGIVFSARAIANAVLEDAANTPGSDQGLINAASRLLDNGDKFHEMEKYSEAVKKYKDAVVLAQKALL